MENKELEILQSQFTKSWGELKGLLDQQADENSSISEMLVQQQQQLQEHAEVLKQLIRQQ